VSLTASSGSMQTPMIERPRAVTTLRSILEREGRVPFRRSIHG